MKTLTILFTGILAITLSGCGFDSVEPWLALDSTIPATSDLEGLWEIENSAYLFGSTEYIINIENKHEGNWQCNYLVDIRPKKAQADARFVFMAFLHEVNGIQFLQLARFSNWYEEMTRLASRPTYSLWRVEYDKNNIVLSLFGDKDLFANLKTVKDSDGKDLFVDTLANNQKLLSDWCETYWHKGEKERLPLVGFSLKRQGAAFVLPDAVNKHAPLKYQKWKRRESEQSGPAYPPQGVGSADP